MIYNSNVIYVRYVCEYFIKPHVLFGRLQLIYFVFLKNIINDKRNLACLFSLQDEKIYNKAFSFKFKT